MDTPQILLLGDSVRGADGGKLSYDEAVVEAMTG